MSQPLLVTLLQALLLEQKETNRLLRLLTTDPMDISPEEREVFMEAATEQIVDHQVRGAKATVVETDGVPTPEANLYKTPKDSKSPSLQAQLLAQEISKPTKQKKKKGTPSE